MPKLPQTIGKLRENLVFIFIRILISFILYWTCVHWLATYFIFVEEEFNLPKTIFLGFIMGLAVATYNVNRRMKMNKESE